jgi:hypothetical protein
MQASLADCGRPVADRVYLGHGICGSRHNVNPGDFCIGPFDAEGPMFPRQSDAVCPGSARGDDRVILSLRRQDVRSFMQMF